MKCAIAECRFSPSRQLLPDHRQVLTYPFPLPTSGRRFVCGGGQVRLEVSRRTNSRTDHQVPVGSAAGRTGNAWWDARVQGWCGDRDDTALRPGGADRGADRGADEVDAGLTGEAAAVIRAFEDSPAIHV